MEGVLSTAGTVSGSSLKRRPYTVRYTVSRYRAVPSDTQSAGTGPSRQIQLQVSRYRVVPSDTQQVQGRPVRYTAGTGSSRQIHSRYRAVPSDHSQQDRAVLSDTQSAGQGRPVRPQSAGTGTSCTIHSQQVQDDTTRSAADRTNKYHITGPIEERCSKLR